MDNKPNGTDTIASIHGRAVPDSPELGAVGEALHGRGYKVINQSWRGLEGEVEELRRDPKPIAKLSVSNIPSQ